MAQALQKPPYVYMGGKLVAWDNAHIHVGAAALIRGISVFEGIKGYWRHDNSEFGLLALQVHYNRLARSALLQYLPFSMTFAEFQDACLLLTRKLLTKEKDLWLRTTLCAMDGHWGADTATDLIITCYHQEKKRQKPMGVGISTWQRPLDTALPARMKSAANYQIGRLARIEGDQQGFSDMILLNQFGRVAEASASCVLVIRDGSVVTPPPYEGCLESVTVNIVEALCHTLGIPFLRRPIDRTELLVADEIALVGTLMEIGVVDNMAGRLMPKSIPVLTLILDEYWACMRGQRQHTSVDLTTV